MRLVQPAVTVQVHIEFTEEQDQIRLEGPPEDVEHATSMLKDIVNDLVCLSACVSVCVSLSVCLSVCLSLVIVFTLFYNPWSPSGTFNGTGNSSIFTDFRFRAWTVAPRGGK